MAEHDLRLTDAVDPGGLLLHGDRGTALDIHCGWLSELASDHERLIVATVLHRSVGWTEWSQPGLAF